MLSVKCTHENPTERYSSVAPVKKWALTQEAKKNCPSHQAFSQKLKVGCSRSTFLVNFLKD